MTDRKHLTFFESVCGADRVFSEEPMSRHTTFRVGGPADYFLVPGDPDQLKKLVRYCKDNGIAFFILGNGSNLLVSDDGYRGAVIQLFRNMSEIRIEGTRIYADAGALLSQIAAQAAAASLTGLEFAGGIPGTLGGACVMNAGAYGGEMKDVLLTVTVLTPSGEVVTVPASSMELGYRTSCIPGRGYIVLGAGMELSAGNAEEIRAKMDSLRVQRQEKQPLDLPSAGSTFKRPEGYFAGKLIMDAGLRGYSVGGAQVSEKHCGFVVNRGGATAEDVRTLIREVRARVEEQFGVRLEPEVRSLGNFDR